MSSCGMHTQGISGIYRSGYRGSGLELRRTASSAEFSPEPNQDRAQDHPRKLMFPASAAVGAITHPALRTSGHPSPIPRGLHEALTLHVLLRTIKQRLG